MQAGRNGTRVRRHAARATSSVPPGPDQELDARAERCLPPQTDPVNAGDDQYDHGPLTSSFAPRLSGMSPRDPRRSPRHVRDVVIKSHPRTSARMEVGLATLLCGTSRTREHADVPSRSRRRAACGVTRFREHALIQAICPSVPSCPSYWVRYFSPCPEPSCWTYSPIFQRA